MLKSNHVRAAVLAVIALSTLSPTAGWATLIDLTPTGLSFTPCGDCTTFGGRSIYIRANASLAIDSVSWFGNVTSGDYELVISEGLGEGNPTLGTQIALASVTLSGGVLGWNDIAVSAILSADQEYVVNLRRQDGEAFSSDYDFLDWGNGLEESDLGAITLLDGRHGFDAEAPDNSWTTHFRFDAVAVPEPSTFAMSALGLTALGVFGRRRVPAFK
jgi:hypothetical protein